MQDWLAYEHYVCQHHAKLYGRTVYHWSNVPEHVLIDSGFIDSPKDWRLLCKAIQNRKQMREFGLDSIAISSDGVYHGIQAKFWNSTLCVYHIGSFFAVMHGRFKKKNILSKGYLYHTTTLQRDLHNDLKCMDNIVVHHLQFESPCNSEPGASDECFAINEPNFQLHEPQKQALDALISVYRSGWSGSYKLKLPCGMGKTLVTAKFMQNIDVDMFVIISPLCVHADQTLQ